MSAPSHRRRPAALALEPPWRRVALLVLVVGALVGAGLAAHLVAVPSAPTAPSPGVVSLAAPAGAESSSWYCTGGPGTGNAVTLYLDNAGSTAVSGTITVTNSDGSTDTSPVSVPADGQSSVDPLALAPGPWLASRVDLDGGAVTVTELVSGPYGWSTAPCSTVAGPQWDFASGATTTGSTMYLSVYNPTAATAVVDLTFHTPSGVIEPRPFEGLVVAPGQVLVAEVATYVQNQASVSTEVVARSGEVVAAMLEEYSSNSTSGLSLRLGAAQPGPRWVFPRSVDVTGGRVAIAVFNPSATSERVSVATRIASGPLAPFTFSLPAGATTSLVVSTATRVPANTDYATVVTATSGAGVVVDRVVSSSSAGTVPQWGAVAAVGANAGQQGHRRWVLANPAQPDTSAVYGASVLALSVQNPSSGSDRVTVAALDGGGTRHISTITVPAGGFAVFEPSILAMAGTDPLLVTSTGPLAAMGDGTPAGMPGVVGIPAIPLSG